MRLSSLELQGFKSFPDKTRLEFDDGITAVVGPNGSGKSNIADAVRWVLGEQSTKTLRGNRMEDVIFGGTQTRKAVGYSMVQLTIDNTDKTMPEYADEIAISRRLYRSGESEYRINGVAMRLRDIHELFMDTGLGRDGYSIIGQGRIAEIVSAKSAQRREIFEEAAGIAKFRYRRTEAERRLAAAHENMLRLADILTELEARVEPLRVQSQKAKKFLELADERKDLEISLWVLSLDTLKGQLSEQENKVLIAKNDYQQLEAEAEKLEQELADTFVQMQEFSVAADERRLLIRNLEERLAAENSQVAVMQNDIQHNQTTIQKLELELDGAGVSDQEILQQLEQKKAQQTTEQTQLAAHRSRMQAVQERIEEQGAQVSRLAQELEQLQIRKSSLEQGMTEIRLEQAASATRRIESSSRLESLQQNGTTYDKAVEEYQSNVEECTQQIEEQGAAISSLENTRKGYQLKLESRQKKQQELQEKQKHLADKSHQSVSRMKILKDLETNMEGFAAV